MAIVVSEHARDLARSCEIVDLHLDTFIPHRLWGYDWYRRHDRPFAGRYFMKHVDLPPDMQRAIAKQAEAEREKRAKIIHAEGEFQASTQLANAAEVIAKQPLAVTLRYLQTATEVAGDKNSTLIFPLPVDLLSVFMPKVDPGKDPGAK